MRYNVIPLQKGFRRRNNLTMKKLTLKQAQNKLLKALPKRIHKTKKVFFKDFYTLGVDDGYIQGRNSMLTDIKKIIKELKRAPLIFHVNYFLRGRDGRFLNGIKDKHVWVKWMELRVNEDVRAIKTPIGYIPKYEDLQALFRKILDKDYARGDYTEQFKIRIPECIAKIERIKNIYHTKVFMRHIF